MLFSASSFALLPVELLAKVINCVARRCIFDSGPHPNKGIQRPMTLPELMEWLLMIYPSPGWQAAVKLSFAQSSMPKIPSGDTVIGSLVDEHRRALAVCVAGGYPCFLTVTPDRNYIQFCGAGGECQLHVDSNIVKGLLVRQCNVAVTDAFDAAVITESGGGAWLFRAEFGWKAAPVMPRDSRPDQPPSSIVIGERMALLFELGLLVTVNFHHAVAICEEPVHNLHYQYPLMVKAAAICEGNLASQHIVAAAETHTRYFTTGKTGRRMAMCQRNSSSWTQKNAGKILAVLACGMRRHIELREMGATLFTYVCGDTHTRVHSNRAEKATVLLKHHRITAGTLVCDKQLLVVATTDIIPGKRGDCTSTFLRVVRLCDGSLLHVMPVHWGNGPPTKLTPMVGGLFAQYSRCVKARHEFLQWRLWPDSLEVHIACESTPLPIAADAENMYTSHSECYNTNVLSTLPNELIGMFYGSDARIWHALSCCSKSEQLSVAKQVYDACWATHKGVATKMLGVIVHRLEAKNSLPKMDTVMYVLVRILSIVYGFRRFPLITHQLC